jgi:predicted NAD/FAD-dependent oxidoreductase
MRAADDKPLKVAIVGAGLSGLVCARILSDHGHRVRALDKARGPGGRMSTRRAGDWQFDHGAQYFTVRDPRFSGSVDGWLQDGIVAPWNGRIAVLDHGSVTVKEGDSTERFVAVPEMNAICRHLAMDVDVVYGTRIDRLERRANQWRLASSEGIGIGFFDAVVVSAPAPQTAALLESVAPVLSRRAAAVKMAPCWAVMVAFGRPLDLAFDGAFVHGSPLSWVARNASKPGRPDGETWVLHGSPEWSQQHLELEAKAAAERLFDAFRDAVVGLLEELPVHLVAHRWRFALPITVVPDECLFDPDLSLAACGDWCGGPRVEGAFLSGRAAARRILSLRQSIDAAGSRNHPDTSSEEHERLGREPPQGEGNDASS